MKSFTLSEVNFPQASANGRRVFCPRNGSRYNMGDFAEAVAAVYFGVIDSVDDYTHNSVPFYVAGDISLADGSEIQVKALNSGLTAQLNGSLLIEKINDYMNRSAANSYLIMIADYKNDSFNCFQLSHEEMHSFLNKHTKLSDGMVRLSDSMKDLVRYGAYAL